MVILLSPRIWPVHALLIGAPTNQTDGNIPDPTNRGVANRRVSFIDMDEWSPGLHSDVP